ncbi:O-antigen polymerase, partial [Vibrio breoganii]
LIVNKVVVKKYLSFTIFPWMPYLVILCLYDLLNKDLISIGFPVYFIFYTYAIVYFIFEIIFSSLLNKVNVGVTQSFYINQKYVYYSKVIGSILIIILLYYYVKSVAVLSVVGPEKYRSIATGYSGEVSPVFGSSLVQLFYFYVIQGVIILLTVTSAFVYFSGKIKSLTLIVLVLVLLDSGITFGRFMFYYFVVIYLFMAMLFRAINVRKFISIILFGLCILTLMYYLSAQRFSSGDLSFEQFILRYVVGYHFYPIALLTVSFEAVPPIGGDWDGSAFFSSYSYYLSKFINLTFGDYKPFLTSAEFLTRGDYQFVGKDGFGQSLYVNAFYPMFLDMYNDLGYFGITFFTILLAFLMTMLKPHRNSKIYTIYS